MSIVRLCRVSLCGQLQDKEAVLDGLQALGALHLIPLRPPEPLAPVDPEGHHRARTALRHLMETPEQLRPHRSDQAFDLEETVAQILQNRRRLRELTDRRDEPAVHALPVPRIRAGLGPPSRLQIGRASCRERV
jgi:V/A-type H+-transporting ATPase subunit I